VDSQLKAFEVNAEYMNPSHRRNYRITGLAGRDTKMLTRILEPEMRHLVPVLRAVTVSRIKLG